jgi:ATP-dependent helicase HrpA
MLAEKVVALLRGLPKELRRELVPIPDAAIRFRATLGDQPGGNLFDHLARFVTAETGKATEAETLRGIDLPPALRMNLRVLDDGGHEMKRGRNLEVLRRELRASARDGARVEPGGTWARDGVRRWDFGEVPQELKVMTAGVTLRMFPAIEDAGAAVRLRLYPDAARARQLSRDGIVRLAALAMPQQHDLARRLCANDREFPLLAASAGLGRSLFDEVADRAVADSLAMVGGSEPRTAGEFDSLVDASRQHVADCGAEVVRVVRSVLLAAKEARAALEGLRGSAFGRQRESIERQLSALLSPGWVRYTSEPWFHQLPKYLRTVARRAARVSNEVERDRKLEAQVAPYEAALRELASGADRSKPAPERDRLRWMIEEFRVSLFAQELKTLAPVSGKRLDEQLRLARREL